MPLIARVPATEYMIAVYAAPFTLSDPNERALPMTAPLSARSARLLSMGTKGLSTKTHRPSRWLRSERSAFAPARSVRHAGQLRFGVCEQLVDRLLQFGVRRIERRRLAFERESGVVMLQPRIVQPVDLRDPLDPSSAPPGEPHMPGRAVDKAAPLMGPAPLQDHLAVELAGQSLVGREAIAHQDHGAFGRTEQELRDLGAARGVDVVVDRIPRSPRSTARPGSSAPSRDTPERAMSSRRHDAAPRCSGARESPWPAARTAARSA